MGIIHIVHTPMGGGEGSRQINTIAYEEEGGFQSCVRTQKKVFSPQSLKTFLFLQKKPLHCHLLLCIEKSNQS